MKQSSNRQKGFTLIELVMVIVLIGALSVGASSLFFSKGDYTAFVAQGQLLSSALLAQQVALGMSATSNPVSLTVSVNGDGDWQFTLNKSGQPAQILTQQSSGGSLIVDGVTFSSGSSQTFTWNSQANLTSGTNHSIRFVAETTSWVCLSSSGYAYRGSGSCP
ncbi:MAG: type II secretion system protein [Oleiphilaceae bacterium]|nr:type II secretion system protein [Oleiphilaceae bacterium]